MTQPKPSPDTMYPPPDHESYISRELAVPRKHVSAVIELLNEGASIPFIARYRKERTGNLDAVALTAIRDRFAALQDLDARRMSILKSLFDRDLLTETLKTDIIHAETLAALEDIYLPFRPKRRTRATRARERGLEPLADQIFQQKADVDPRVIARPFIDTGTEVADTDAALAGARDIIAEWIAENADIRARIRTLFMEQGIFHTSVIHGKAAAGSKYRDYFEGSEPVQSAPSHRILAMRRGEKEGILSLRISVDDEQAMTEIFHRVLTASNPCADQVRIAAEDGYKRLLSPSIETEIRAATKQRADAEAIRVFADNVKQRLLAPPLGSQRILAVDPGFRTGCKVVCLDRQGALRHFTAIYPHSGARDRAQARSEIQKLINEFRIEAVAVGNGTAGRETEVFFKEINLPSDLPVIMVNESGASIYSASEAAREEFPDHDITVRGAVSIGRRLMDPLAELVKIDPKSIGVGQYQHDVDQKALKQSLDDTVMHCVNVVGANVNTASKQLLAYVSGLGPQLAANIVAWRNEHGAFPTRSALKKVPRLGPKAFEQAAGFLRITGGKNPLDASAVHPESYPIVRKMARDLGCTVTELMQSSDHRDRIRLTDYVTDVTGLPTLKDIIEELARPGRDPRDRFEVFQFAEGIQTLEDLKPGMRVPGIVTNVTRFGAFVDIGVHQDGLVHISQLANRFVKDPSDIVSVDQHVTVTVLEVDIARRRISLSLRNGD